MEVSQIKIIFFGLFGIILFLLFSSDIANTKNLYWKEIKKGKILYRNWLSMYILFVM